VGNGEEMDNTSKSVENVKKVNENEFHKVLKGDKVLEAADKLILDANKNLIDGFNALAFGDGSEEENKKLIDAIIKTQKEIEKSFMMRHFYIMAQYAKFKKDESPESPAKNTYW
jgi:hypothetical protein